MAKDNNSGLLSKVVKFVRHPTTNWSDLDRPEPEPDDGYSKQALKELIERKRQNDFVRKHEFDQLRKLRRSESERNAEQAGRPSFFQSSIPSNPDERAMTLKKIDEIEAQMSKQWWKGREDEASVQAHSTSAASTSSAPGRDPAPVTLSPTTSGSGFAMTAASTLSSPVSSGDHADFVPTQMGTTASPLPASESERQGRPAAAGRTAGAAGDAGAGRSPAQPLAMQPVDAKVDPDLEEAAIGFANGDDAGVEVMLLNALQRDHVRRDLAEGWMAALFDLYRATGQQTRFDRVAIDFAERFGRSAPAWFSIPDSLGRKTGITPAQAAMPASTAAPIWTSPAELHLQAAQALRAAVADAASPWHLDWSPLLSIGAEAVELLGKLFSDWCDRPVSLRFVGTESLERALGAATPSGDASVSPALWLLRMDALRIMRRHDEFDLVALDYCVTYEVSPPSWQDTLCEFARENANPPVMAAVDGMNLRDVGGKQGRSPAAPQGAQALAVTELELSGEIEGDATQALGKFEAGFSGTADRLVISCARLIRVDFSAAGSILNWVAARQSEGCHVQFRDVHHLVAAFFDVIGISEHARVIPRTS